jgi:hypothetical protein
VSQTKTFCFVRFSLLGSGLFRPTIGLTYYVSMEMLLIITSPCYKNFSNLKVTLQFSVSVPDEGLSLVRKFAQYMTIFDIRIVVVIFGAFFILLSRR